MLIFTSNKQKMNSLDRARIAAYGNYANSQTLKGGRINIKQSDEVRDANMLNNYQHRPRGTRVSNNQPTTNNIAIYAREPHELMLNETIGNELFVKIRNSNKPKIRTSNEDLIPNTGAHYEIEKFSLNDPKINNKNPYYPQLDISQYNTIPKDMKPTMIDSRMLQYTQERDFNYESDQIENARVLKNDPRRWDKLNRQAEADRRLQGLGSGMDNWIENKSGYVNRSTVPPRFIVDQTLKKTDNNTNYNETKDELLTNNLTEIQRDSLYPMNQFYDVRLSQKDYNHIYSGNSDMILNREMNRNDYNQRFDFDETKPEVKRGFFQSVSDAVLKLFRKDVSENVNENRHLADVENAVPIDVNVENYESLYDRGGNIGAVDARGDFIEGLRHSDKQQDIFVLDGKYDTTNRNLVVSPEAEVSFARFNLK